MFLSNRFQFYHFCLLLPWVYLTNAYRRLHTHHIIFFDASSPLVLFTSSQQLKQPGNPFHVVVNDCAVASTSAKSIKLSRLSLRSRSDDNGDIDLATDDLQLLNDQNPSRTLKVVTIDENEIEERFVRSSGKGGQKVRNKSLCYYLLRTCTEIQYLAI